MIEDLPESVREGVLTEDKAVVCRSLGCPSYARSLANKGQPGCHVLLARDDFRRELFGNMRLSPVMEAQLTKVTVKDLRRQIPNGCPEGFDIIRSEIEDEFI
ncbi:MAG: hypothetical protein US86_C0001G0032 [Candidatus Daviesbacteria bacterium GW2011_GWA2_38_24]|uniref:Uncharacterized protein n=1 Tax=Candidatus Daviesbacteria bacterium GW2011_GWA2_38_24 TaxID=1618422 RepID=A0A0G0JVL0_9BACT|nr:MAG: hypothetical protein US86_C0001G0032 [Candidatus Daviesbacteria bacterium GW2011_GWA2_38_24]KKQ80141.1 MAG: hypothetical protein UT01_C0018G0006 [Candidatus Daviesbacteria bacterium GW2011_GWA1_38_7]OGE22782.1 MAG: hypothetical protein A2688_00815 [Candidatus Daviesbacteria bacterium RIFCSPHIGHO2_01_FULL_38_8]